MTFNGLHVQDPLHCLFALSLFWWPQPLRNISEWVFSFKGLGLLRTTLCAPGSFGKGKMTAQNQITLILCYSAQGSPGRHGLQGLHGNHGFYGHHGNQEIQDNQDTRKRQDRQICHLKLTFQATSEGQLSQFLRCLGLSSKSLTPHPPRCIMIHH